MQVLQGAELPQDRWCSLEKDLGQPMAGSGILFADVVGFDCVSMSNIISPVSPTLQYVTVRAL